MLDFPPVVAAVLPPPALVWPEATGPLALDPPEVGIGGSGLLGGPPDGAVPVVPELVLTLVAPP